MIRAISQAKVIAKSTTHTAIYPSRYLSFSRELDIQSPLVSKSSEIWDMEFAQNANIDSIFYFVGVVPPFNEYLNLTANLLAPGGNKVPIPITYEYRRLSTANGEALQLKVPFIKIPSSPNTQRIIAKFTISSSTTKGNQSGDSLVLPYDLPVDDAQLILRSPANAAANASIASNGFELKENIVKGDQFMQRFVMRGRWIPSTHKSPSEVPFLFTSYSSFESQAASVGKLYKSEIKKAFDIPSALSTTLAGARSNGNPEVTRISAHIIFKWMKDNFTYRALLNPDFSIAPRPAIETLKNKMGDCKDLSLIYMMLLSQAGIRSEPVLVFLDEFHGAYPTRSNIPNISEFNHIIVHIPEIDEYVDLTGSNDGFALDSAAFSNTFGLHIFSERLLSIKPRLIRHNVNIKTVIQKTHDGWIGATRWLGQNEGHLWLVSIQKQWEKYINAGNQLDNLFQRNGLVFYPKSWNVERDDLHAKTSIGFSYVLQNPPVNDHGKLVTIPSSIMAAVLLKYDETERLKRDKYFCFGSTLSEERIQIDGADGSEIPKELRRVKILGVNSEYTQNISISGGKVILERRMLLNEKRAYCSEAENISQQIFYKNVKRSVGESNTYGGPVLGR